MPVETEKQRSFEDKGQDRQDWIESNLDEFHVAHGLVLSEWLGSLRRKNSNKLA